MSDDTLSEKIAIRTLVLITRLVYIFTFGLTSKENIVIDKIVEKFICTDCTF